MNVKIIKFLDRTVGAVGCGVYSLFRHFYSKEYKIKKVLFIQLWGIGETILTLPAIKAFKEKYPDSEVSVICTKRNKDVFYNQKFIDDVIEMDMGLFAINRLIFKNLKKFDIVIDFEEYLNLSAIIAYLVGKFRAGYSHGIRGKMFNKVVEYNDKQHVVETHMDLVRLFGADADIKKLVRLKYSKDDKKKAEELLVKLGIRSNDILIGFGAGVAESAKSRMWPEERFAELGSELLRKYKNARLLFFGTDDEKELNQRIIDKVKSINNVFNLAGMMSLRQLFALAEKCSLIISNDTGVMHIGAAQQVKTIGLFGPNLPVRWGPFGEGNVSIYKGMVCKYSPCINVHKGEVPECRYGSENRCMKAISVRDIMNHL